MALRRRLETICKTAVAAAVLALIAGSPASADSGVRIFFGGPSTIGILVGPDHHYHQRHWHRPPPVRYWGHDRHDHRRYRHTGQRYDRDWRHGRGKHRWKDRDRHRHHDRRRDHRHR